MVMPTSRATQGSMVCRMRSNYSHAPPPGRAGQFLLPEPSPNYFRQVRAFGKGWIDERPLVPERLPVSTQRFQ